MNANKEIRVSKAVEKKKHWEKDSVKEVFFAFLLCGAPGANLETLTALSTPDCNIGSKRGRREMRGMGGNGKSVNEVPLVNINNTRKEQMHSTFTFQVEKETLQEYIALMEDKGLQSSEEYKLCKDKYFALLRARLNLSTSSSSIEAVNDNEKTPTSHESSFTVMSAIRNAFYSATSSATSSILDSNEDSN